MYFRGTAEPDETVDPDENDESDVEITEQAA